MLAESILNLNKSFFLSIILRAFNPTEPVDPQTGEPIGDLGAPIQEPDLESEGGATEAPTIPSGGEI